MGEGPLYFPAGASETHHKRSKDIYKCIQRVYGIHIPLPFGASTVISPKPRARRGRDRQRCLCRGTETETEKAADSGWSIGGRGGGLGEVEDQSARGAAIDFLELGDALNLGQHGRRGMRATDRFAQQVEHISRQARIS
jgi:hypothetical protein